MTTIVCIEDEPDLLEDLAEALTDAGYNVLQAKNGEEGLEMIKDHRPELVVSDISMPGMDGYDLLKEVRENNRQLAQMPFIFLSALSARDERIKGLDSGADEYLTKPVDFDVLVSKVQSIFRMRERMRKDFEVDRARLLEHQQDVYGETPDEDEDIVLA